MNAKIYNKRRISSSQKGMENVAEGTKYDDYHINTKGMGILSVENIIEEIEGRGNQAVLTVQTSDGSTNHSQFGSKDWKEYKDSVNNAGNAITDVWVTEVEGGSYVRNSRRPIKSRYDILNVGNKTPAGNLVFYLVNDGKRMPIMTEDYAIHEGGYDKDYLYEGSKNGEFVRFDGFSSIINRLAEGCGLGEEIEQIEYYITGNKVTFTVYPTERGIHLLNNGWWDDYSVRWELSAEEQIPLYGADEKVAMSVELTILGLSNDLTSSRKITSARYIATDPKSGEVLGSADTYEEAVNEWGEDVTITDSETAEGQQEEEGLFSSYEEETEEDDVEIESSKKPSGDKAFLSKIVSAFCTGTMTEEQAIKRVMLRNNCNIGYARQILSSAMDDASLIQSGTMEIAEDLNKDFNIDGDFESWSEDYVPQAGKANTIGGEILRATAQIVNRFYNDGDKIGIGKGKETVNPAARYILENAVEFTAVPDDLQAMLDNNSDINLSDESYEEWVDDFKYAVEDYLRNHEELFHAPNKVDMWDFKQESDEKTPITDIFIEDDDGNRYSFQGGPEGWHCYGIYFADGPKYNVGDFVNSGDIKAAGGDTSEEFVTFNIDGYTYSAELYDNDEYEITDVESSNQLVHKDEEWTTEDLEKYKIYNSEDESELSIEDLY